MNTLDYIPRKTRGVPSQNFVTHQTTATGGISRDFTMNFLLDNTKTTPGRRDLGVSGFTYDFTYTLNGYYISAAYTKYTGSASNSVEAYNYTLGYLFTVKSIQIMPVFKYDVIEGDFNRNGVRDNTDILRNYWIGANIFGDRHLMKFQLFYQIQKDYYGINAFTNQRRDMNNNLIIFQVQMTFWTGTLRMEDKD
jgi:hypothetical protein